MRKGRERGADMDQGLGFRTWDNLLPPNAEHIRLTCRLTADHCA